MAKILITVPPLAGHVNPALSVASELRRRGHEVAWAAHTQFIPDLLPEDAEVWPLPMPSSFDSGKRSSAVRGLESVKFFYEEFCLPLARASLLPLQEIVRTMQPDLMICDHQMIAGALVARAVGCPWLTFASTNVSILKMSEVVDKWVEQQFAELQRDYGVPVLARPDFSPYGVIVFSSEALLDGRYAYYEAPYRFVGPAFTHRQMAIEFPWQELRRDAAKILISLGTVSRDRGMRFYEVMMTALEDLQLRDGYLPYRHLQVVMVAPEELRAGAPRNFIVRPRVPQVTLLAHMDAVLCHAGHNTVCEALSFGLPLIVAPIRDDQPIVARQVIDAGAALHLRYGKVTAASVRTAVEELFHKADYRDNALRLKKSFESLGGARHAANLVEELLSREDSAAGSRPNLVRPGVSRAMG